MIPENTDIFVIGGGVNGVAIARDAAGRGMSVRLAEMNDLGAATSSASTKLFHGGLRYLEFMQFGMVREALSEREVLLKAMPHISWPLSFVLPYRSNMQFDRNTPVSRLLSVLMPWIRGRRPRWVIRLGLFVYDHLGKRTHLPSAKACDLRNAPEGEPLKPTFVDGFEYSDCWVEDARLVSLMGRDAAERGADILTRSRVTGTRRSKHFWTIDVEDCRTGECSTFTARALINASGPWVGQLLRDQIDVDTKENVRLVRGSHIVTRKLYDHDKAYFFQGTDGRIIFAIPYEQDFTLIGTTEVEHEGSPDDANATPAEIRYLCEFASEYFAEPVSSEDVVWTFSGVRPLYDDGATSATAASRDYMLSIDTDEAPFLSVFGGKITTHRKLAEEAVSQVGMVVGQKSKPWTSGAPLPGGDFPVDGFELLVSDLAARYPFLSATLARRFARALGTDASIMLSGFTSLADLGRNFGLELYECEVRWLMDREFAETADDIVWRRTKRGLRMTSKQISELDEWMKQARETRHLSAAE